MINSNRGNTSDKILLGGMGFAVIGMIITMGIWWFFIGGGSTKESTGGSSEAQIIYSRERIDSFTKNSFNDLENMSLLELINLKETIMGFGERGKKDFEIDASGILEIFK